MLDSNFRGGGVAVINSLRTTIDNCYISHFTTTGISIEDGHETIVTNSFIGQYINVGGDTREKYYNCPLAAIRDALWKVHLELLV